MDCARNSTSGPANVVDGGKLEIQGIRMAGSDSAMSGDVGRLAQWMPCLFLVLDMAGFERIVVVARNPTTLRPVIFSVKG